MEVAGCGVDVVVGRVVVGDVGPEVVERAQELLRDGSLKLLPPDRALKKGAELVVPGPDDVARLRRSSRRRLCAQRDRGASLLTLPDASRRQSPPAPPTPDITY